MVIRDFGTSMVLTAAPQKGWSSILDLVQNRVLWVSVTIAPIDQLREHGLQVTNQRLAVLRAISSRPHVTADEIADIAQADIGGISRQAVYDALAVLVDNDLLRRIQPVGSAARYEDRVNDNHHHLICRQCARVVDVDCAVGSAPCLTASDDHGYDIDEADVAYWGICPECQTANGVADSSASVSISISNEPSSAPFFPTNQKN